MPSPCVTKQDLRRLYTCWHLEPSEVAQILKVGTTTVMRWMTGDMQDFELKRHGSRVDLVHEVMRVLTNILDRIGINRCDGADFCYLHNHNRGRECSPVEAALKLFHTHPIPQLSGQPTTLRGLITDGYMTAAVEEMRRLEDRLSRKG